MVIAYRISDEVIDAIMLWALIAIPSSLIIGIICCIFLEEINDITEGYILGVIIYFAIVTWIIFILWCLNILDTTIPEVLIFVLVPFAILFDIVLFQTIFGGENKKGDENEGRRILG